MGKGSAAFRGSRRVRRSGWRWKEIRPRGAVCGIVWGRHSPPRWQFPRKGSGSLPVCARSWFPPRHWLRTTRKFLPACIGSLPRRQHGLRRAFCRETFLPGLALQSCGLISCVCAEETRNSVAEPGNEWHEVGTRIAQLALMAIWALLGVEILARHAKHVVTLYANTM